MSFQAIHPPNLHTRSNPLNTLPTQSSDNTGLVERAEVSSHDPEEFHFLRKRHPRISQPLNSLTKLYEDATSMGLPLRSDNSHIYIPTNYFGTFERHPFNMTMIEFPQNGGATFLAVVALKKAVFMIRMQPVKSYKSFRAHWRLPLRFTRFKEYTEFSLQDFCREQGITEANSTNGLAKAFIITPRAPSGSHSIVRDEKWVIELKRALRRTIYAAPILPDLPIRTITYDFQNDNRFRQTEDLQITGEINQEDRNVTILFRYENDKGIHPSVSATERSAAWALWVSGQEHAFVNKRNETFWAPSDFSTWPQLSTQRSNF